MDEMETPASNAATDGGYGVSDTQHQAEIVLGKGKVDGSIPFGSTIPNPRKSADFLGSGPLPKDIPPGSNEPDISDFIARGGSIKRGPTLVADGVRFWSPCSQPKLDVVRPLQVVDYKAGVSAIFNRKGFPKANRHSFKPGQAATKTSFKPGVRSRGAELAAAKGAARLARLSAEYAGGKTVEDMARDEGCRVTRIRELLRKAGVL